MVLQKNNIVIFQISKKDCRNINNYYIIIIIKNILYKDWYHI